MQCLYAKNYSFIIKKTEITLKQDMENALEIFPGAHFGKMNGQMPIDEIAHRWAVSHS